jgi:nicotinate-nucleotide pyrophosphorylase (carboxylating)
VMALHDKNERQGVSVSVLIKDGSRVKKGDVIATLSGDARTLLAGERLALNLLSHLSGVATQTAQYVAKVAHTKAKILDTRKTTPLWRDLEKYAVKCGGGENHRRGLYDMILIKDNHLALWGAHDPAGAVNAARARYPQTPIEVEVTDLAGLQHVCGHSQPQMVLLDNFQLNDLRAAVLWCDKFFAEEKKNSPRPLLEASGGITLSTLAAIGETGVDRISAGALTHSVGALDISLELKF